MGSYAYNYAVAEDGHPFGGRHCVLSVSDRYGECVKLIDVDE